jgi:hypothetical protein
MSIHYYDQPQAATAVQPHTPARMYAVGTHIIFVKGASTHEMVAIRA